MKKSWRIFLIIILALVAFLGGSWGYLMYGLRETLNVTIENVDLSNLENGVYRGQYRKGRFAYQVEVVVQNHTIETVTLTQVPRISIPAVHEEMVKRVENAGSLAVDTVASATASSKAILKAVENALQKQVK